MKLEHINPCPQEFDAFPGVYAVDDKYELIIPVNTPTVMWVEIGEKKYYDDSNGILRSDCTTHKITVPMDVLDDAGKYSVCYRVVYERSPYHPSLSDVLCWESEFYPIPTEQEQINVYHISDAHGDSDHTVDAGRYFDNKLDLLILNGDIIDHCGNAASFLTIHRITGNITYGQIPTVFSKGNHDTRGKFAERFHELTPTNNGKPYFTFRLGPVWGIVLDCGEDKPDDHPEYGNTVCFHQFRLNQTEFIKNVIDSADEEYASPDVKYRLVISHVPFAHTNRPPFDIEVELYTEWCRLLRDHIKPDLMISGHLHQTFVCPIGGNIDHKGQPAPVVVGSRHIYTEDKDDFVGAAITLCGNSAKVLFTDGDKQVVDSTDITL